MKEFNAVLNVNVTVAECLLQSSDFALRDLTQPFLHCEDADEVDEKPDLSYIVLRQWRSDIIPNSGYSKQEAKTVA